jgi:hypothetical protein
VKTPRRLFLRMAQENGRRVGYILQESENGSKRKLDPLVRIWGASLDAATAQILDGLRASGHRSSVLRKQESRPLPLTDTAGVRLALLFLAVKPLRKLRRLETVAAAIREMEPEETYYWLAKCSRQRVGRRACHALRVLLSKE